MGYCRLPTDLPSDVLPTLCLCECVCVQIALSTLSCFHLDHSFDRRFYAVTNLILRKYTVSYLNNLCMTVKRGC